MISRKAEDYCNATGITTTLGSDETNLSAGPNETGRDAGMRWKAVRELEKVKRKQKRNEKGGETRKEKAMRGIKRFSVHRIVNPTRDNVFSD